jgi:RNA polymerase-binding transcription factor DksA
VKEIYKDQLEGLLKARSEDMRLARRPRRSQPVTGQAFERTAVARTVSSARFCEACAGEISARRLRAMPSATRCLHCQRSAERAGTPT